MAVPLHNERFGELSEQLVQKVFILEPLLKKLRTMWDGARPGDLSGELYCWFAVFLFFSVYLFLPAMCQVFKDYAWLLVLLEFWFLLASIFEMHTHWSDSRQTPPTFVTWPHPPWHPPKILQPPSWFSGQLKTWDMQAIFCSYFLSHQASFSCHKRWVLLPL